MFVTMQSVLYFQALDEPDFSVAYAKMCEVLKDKAPSTQLEDDPKTVSYTHLTLPTKRIV